MFKSVLLRVFAFLKWLAAPESLPSPALDSQPTAACRKRTFLELLLSRDALPVLEPLPSPLPGRPSFIRYLFSRDSLPNLSDKGPTVMQDGQSQTSKQKGQ